MCLDLSARIGSGPGGVVVMKERSDELSNEETATDRWENEGGRTQLAQQEEVNLTLSGTTAIEPRSEQQVRELLGYGVSLAGQSCGPLSWLDFSFATVLGTRSCQKSLVRW